MLAGQIDTHLVAIIESVYDIERDARSWIAGILRSTEPSVGDGVGLFGFEYVITKSGHLSAKSFTSRGCPDTTLGELPTSALKYESDCAASSEVRDWTESHAARRARAAGIGDSWLIVGRNASNRGLAVIVNRRLPGSPTAAQRDTLTRVAKHFAAAHRLRERLSCTQVESASESLCSGASNASGQTARCALSPRERQVLSLAVLGHPNKEIAFELGIGHSTVRVLLTRAAKKLDARGHADLLRRFETFGCGAKE
jgi:DNA-binding CsgD family transcriptional regulator